MIFLDSINCHDKEEEIFKDKTSHRKNKEECRSILIVHPANFCCIFRFVVFQHTRHGNSIHDIGEQDNQEWNSPRVIRVDLEPSFAGVEGGDGHEGPAHVEADHVHAEHRDQKEIVRTNGDENANCVGMLEIKTKEKEELTNKQGTD